MAIPNVTIIGGGAAGTIAVRQLVRQLIAQNIQDVTIAVYDKNEQIGPGGPYNLNLPSSLILNLPAGAMNPDRNLNPVTASKSDFKEENSNPLPHISFMDWIQANRAELIKRYSDDQLKSDSFPPRELFGKYLIDLHKNTCEIAKKYGITIKNYPGTEVFNLIYDKTENRYSVILKNYQVIDAGEKVILTLGNLPSDNYQQFFDLQDTQYFRSPYDIAIHNAPKDKDYIIAGTRLSAIDAAIRLIEEEKVSGKIFLVSHSGQLPAVLGEKITAYHPKHLNIAEITRSTTIFGITLTLQKLIEIFESELQNALGRKDNPFTEEEIQAILKPKSTPEEWLENQIKAASTGSRPWQDFLFALYPDLSYIWSELNEAGKKEFLEKYYSIWMTYLAAFPLPNAKKLLDYIKQGKIKIVGGLKNIEYDEEEKVFKAHIEGRDPVAGEILINATGSGHDITITNMPLIRNLLDSGMIYPMELSSGDQDESPIKAGIRVDYKSLIPTDPANKKTSPGLHCIGDTTFGNCMTTADLTQVCIEILRVITNITDHLKTDLTISSFDNSSVPNFLDALKRTLYALTTSNPNNRKIFKEGSQQAPLPPQKRKIQQLVDDSTDSSNIEAKIDDSLYNNKKKLNSSKPALQRY